MSSKGLRCLGLAYKDDLGELSGYNAETHPAHKKLLDPSCCCSIESDLVFVGVVGLRVSSVKFSRIMNLENLHFPYSLTKKLKCRTHHVRKFTRQ